MYIWNRGLIIYNSHIYIACINAYTNFLNSAIWIIGDHRQQRHAVARPDAVDFRVPLAQLAVVQPSMNLRRNIVVKDRLISAEAAGGIGALSAIVMENMDGRLRVRDKRINWNGSSVQS